MVFSILIILFFLICVIIAFNGDFNKNKSEKITTIIFSFFGISVISFIIAFNLGYKEGQINTLKNENLYEEKIIKTNNGIVSEEIYQIDTIYIIKRKK